MSIIYYFNFIVVYGVDFLFELDLRQMYTSKTGMISREYQCPFFRSCLCEVQWKLKYDLANGLFRLLCNGGHNGQSHANH